MGLCLYMTSMHLEKGKHTYRRTDKKKKRQFLWGSMSQDDPSSIIHNNHFKFYSKTKNAESCATA